MLIDLPDATNYRPGAAQTLQTRGRPVDAAFILELVLTASSCHVSSCVTKHAQPLAVQIMLPCQKHPSRLQTQGP